MLLLISSDSSYSLLDLFSAPNSRVLIELPLLTTSTGYIFDMTVYYSSSSPSELNTNSVDDDEKRFVIPFCALTIFFIF